MAVHYGSKVEGGADAESEGGVEFERVVVGGGEEGEGVEGIVGEGCDAEGVRVGGLLDTAGGVVSTCLHFDGRRARAREAFEIPEGDAGVGAARKEIAAFELVERNGIYTCWMS